VVLAFGKFMDLSAKSIIESARKSDLHKRIHSPGSQMERSVTEGIGPLPTEYLEFLDEYGAWQFFKTIGAFGSDYYWLGIGWEPKIARTSDNIWFASGYRFTLGYFYFRFDPVKTRFAPQVYAVRGSGFGVYAESFNEWFQSCVRWCYRKLPKKAWSEEFGLHRI
jgi:hypothetical protein